MDLIVNKNDGNTSVYDNVTMLCIKPEDNNLLIITKTDKYVDDLDMVDKYYFEDRKPDILYVVVDKKKIDRYGLPTFVTFGYDLDQLLSVYHGKDYKIFELGEL